MMRHWAVVGGFAWLSGTVGFVGVGSAQNAPSVIPDHAAPAKQSKAAAKPEPKAEPKPKSGQQLRGPVLCAPANAGDLDQVESLLRKNADLNLVDSLGRTPLMLAMARFDTTRVSAGTKPVSDEKRAARKLKIARLLITRGADVRPASEIGLTALHYAAMWPASEKEALELARLLVAKGADVDARMVDGLTPLRMAVDRNRVELARFLVQSGADPNAIDEQEMTPAKRAKALDSAALMQALVK